MISTGTTIARAAAVVLAIWISSRQYRYFDCNGMRTTSLIAGAITLLLLYAAGELLYRTITSDHSSSAKLGVSLKVGALGAVTVTAAAFFTMLTHVCP